MWDINTIRGLEVRNFSEKLRQIAAKDTSADPASWAEENPLWGHCAVAALLFQDLFGGTLVNGKVGSISHYWNKLECGVTVDTTWEQFSANDEYSRFQLITEVSDWKQRDYVLGFTETRKRYELLKQRYSAGE